MKIFFSYPHDVNAPLVERIKADLESRGHEVWFDADRIKSGDDWRNAITRGILNSQRVVAFLSKHAVRDPGVCLNEIAIALADKGEAMVTVLVEPESEVSAPVSITHIQWLKMDDWKNQAQDDGWYRTQLDRLINAIENPSHAGRNEELEILRLALDPMSFYAEIAPHIPGFTGRRWIIDRYTTWLTEEPQSRVLRIEGGPGLGKTAVASYLAHSTKSSVLAVHLCQYNKGESRNPLRLVRTLAYQLATRLPDYRARLLKSVAIQRPETMQGKDPASLWGEIISAPLAGVGKGTIDRQRLAIIIDGLDEATVDGKNPIVELLATEINQLPKWVGVVLTGRPDPELTQRLARYQPLVLRDDDPRNMADLKVYADEWLALEVKAGKLTSTQAQAASEALLARSQGAFLYLSQARVAVAENMLDLTQPKLFPSGLTEIYQRFFERRFPDAWNNGSIYKARVRPLLELVLASPEPLPAFIAREILKWGPYDEPEVIKSIGSLLKRAKGGLAAEDEETLAPFHNSVREWLQDADTAGDFHVRAEQARLPLMTAIWSRYLESKEKDAYGWQVLPDLLPMLDPSEREQVLGAPDWHTGQVLFRLAESLAPKLRFSEAVATWAVQVDFSERLAASAPENAGFARDLSDSYNNLGYMQHTLGNTQAALKCNQQSLAIFERLAASAPDNFEFAYSLSSSLHGVGLSFRMLGQTEKALDYERRSLNVAKDLAARGPDRANFDHDLFRFDGLCEMLPMLRSSEESLGYYQRCLAIADEQVASILDNADFARSLSFRFRSIGQFLQKLGRTEEALDYYRRGLAIAENLATGAPNDTDFARDLSFSFYDVGSLLQTLGRTEEALNYFRNSLKMAEDLSSRAPDDADLARDLLFRFDSVCTLFQTLGRSEEALEYALRSLKIAENLLARVPDDADLARDLLFRFDSVCTLFQTLGRSEEALEYALRSLKIAEDLLARAPENTLFADEVLFRFDTVDTLLQSLDRTEEALNYSRRSLKIAEDRAAHKPDNTCFARDLFFRFNTFGILLQTLGRNEEALNYSLRSLKIAEDLSARAPESADLVLVRSLSLGFSNVGSLLQTLGRSEEALDYVLRSLKIAEDLAARTPDNTNIARTLSLRIAHAGTLLQTLGRNEEALNYCRRSLKIAERLAVSVPENADLASDLRFRFDDVGKILQTLGRTEESLEYFQHSLAIRERLAASAPENADFARDLWVSY